ncbi:MAG: glutamate formimidoyltransferase [Acidobacteriota bacterium]|nr:MAG: glutamate formimidoyltransferase [Acidobacteriota bacterium]
MKQDLIECVMNVSEGRAAETLEAIADSIESVAGASLLSFPADVDHNRAVFTFVGSAGAIYQAALAAFETAIQRIDMNLHRGIHPRIGAVDVVPFVPLGSTTMEECVSLADRFGQEASARYGVPVYLYQESARHPSRRELSTIRKGQFEGLRKLITSDPDRRPDFGPPTLHPTAGASAVGARKILVAYNVALETEDQEPARRIAAQIRESNGGLPGVKALGLFLESRKRAQVSMNLVDYRTTSLKTVFDRVLKEARELDVSVHSSEIIGHAPADSLPPNWPAALQVENPSAGLVLEERIREVRFGVGQG